MKKPTWVIEKEQAKRASAAETVWLFGLHAVRDALRKRSEVHAIRCFHVWALAPGKVMLTACVQTTKDCEDTDDVLRELQTVCRYKFGIHHATFQVTRDADLM